MHRDPVDPGLRYLRSKLPQRALRFLDCDERHPNGPYPTLLAIARCCRTAGVDGFEFEELVSWSGFGESSLFAKGRLGKQCAAAWETTDDGSEPASPDGIRRLVADLRERIGRDDWHGRSGQTDRDVALAVADRCQELGTYSPVLSTRWVAERVSKGHMAVARSFERLRVAGFFQGKPQVTEQRNRRYRVNLRWDSGAKLRFDTSNLVPSTCTVMNVRLHDAFVTKALGQTAGRVWLSTSHPVTAAEVAADYGVSAGTARRHLNNLVWAGLATKSEGRPVVYKMQEATTAELDAIAEWFGTDGWHDRQAETHARQRGARDLYLSR